MTMDEARMTDLVNRACDQSWITLTIPPTGPVQRTVDTGRLARALLDLGVRLP